MLKKVVTVVHTEEEVVDLEVDLTELFVMLVMVVTAVHMEAEVAVVAVILIMDIMV